MKYGLLLLVALVAGCAQLRVLSSGERSVTVEGPIEAWGKTQPMADAECAKAGRKASFKYNTAGYPAQYFYDCVL